MDDIIGAWELTDFTVSHGDTVDRPLGHKPGGMLLYTADGWMSALLTSDPDQTPEQGARQELFESMGAPGGTIAYAGRWERSADGAVIHHVLTSHYRPWVGTALERAVRHRADEVELTTTVHGFDLTLHWRRAGA